MRQPSLLTRLVLTVLQPPLPDIQHALPRTGPIAWALRACLVLYTVFFTIPAVFFLLVLGGDTLPTHPQWNEHSPLVAFARAFLTYSVSNLIWAVTSYGSPPEVDRSRIPPISYTLFSRDWARSWAKGQLCANLQIIPPLSADARIGILGPHAVTPPIPCGPIPCFWLTQITPYPQHDSKVFLYLVGGGYVIGTPFLGAFAYTLVHSTSYAVFAPDYTKALSKEKSFPGPLAEALAAYQCLRVHGWTAQQIVVVGDSAGGGLAWSLVVYLSLLKRSKAQGHADLGVPAKVILISVSRLGTRRPVTDSLTQPWLALPPISDTDVHLYPDILNVPQLQGAARNYLARYPPYPAHPDPFHSEAFASIANAKRAIQHTLRRLLPPRTSVPTKAEHIIPGAPTDPARILDYLLSPSSFIDLSSNHPLYSPASPTSPFLPFLLEVIAQEQVSFFIHTGTAEMFHPATKRFHRSLTIAGIDSTLVQELGGVHCEPLLWPASLGGAPKRCINALLVWLDGKSIRPSVWTAILGF